MSGEKQSAVGNILAAIPQDTKSALVSQLVSALVGALVGLFRRQRPELPPPSMGVPVTPPALETSKSVPPPAVPKAKVSSVRLVLSRAQYSRTLFPEQYDDNPHGTYEGEELRKIRNGEAMNRQSRFWLDLTAYDENGHEIVPAQVDRDGLAFKTRTELTVAGLGTAVTEGRGPDPSGAVQPRNGRPMPLPEYVLDSGGTWIEVEQEAFNASCGFLSGYKAWGEGEIRAVGYVDGVKSNEIVIRVS